MRIEHLRQRLADLGAKPVHVQRMLRAWTHALPLSAGPVPALTLSPGRTRTPPGARCA